MEIWKKKLAGVFSEHSVHYTYSKWPACKVFSCVTLYMNGKVYYR